MTTHTGTPAAAANTMDLGVGEQILNSSQGPRRNADEGTTLLSNNTFIHHMPPEILARIFELLLDDASFTEHYLWLTTLLLVCSRWKALIDETSSLWTRISSDYTAYHIAVVIRKSKNQPLLVHFNGILLSYFKVPRNSFSDPNCFWLLHKIHPIARRWRTVSLVNIPGPYVPGTLGFLKKAVNLEHLHLESPMDPLETWALLDVLQNRPSKLQSLSLRSGILEHLAPALSGFTALKLSHFTGCSDNSMDELRTVLISNPRLVHLSLEYISLRKASEEPWQPIGLPELTTLQIVAQTEILISHVLPAIHAPALKRLHVTSGYSALNLRDRVPTETFLELILSTSHFAQTSPVVSFYVTAPRLSLWFVERIEITYSSTDNGVKYLVDIGAAQWLGSFAHALSSKQDSDELESLSANLHIAKTNTLDDTILNREGTQYIDEVAYPWIDAICDCPKSENKSTKALCQRLSTPTINRDAIVAWPFSSACALELSSNNPEDDQAILAMVQARRAASGDAVNGRRSKTRPQMLQRLTIQTQDASRVQELVDDVRGMLGFDAVRVTDEKPHVGTEVSDYCCGVREFEGVWCPISAV